MFAKYGRSLLHPLPSGTFNRGRHFPGLFWGMAMAWTWQLQFAPLPLHITLLLTVVNIIMEICCGLETAQATDVQITTGFAHIWLTGHEHGATFC